MQLPLVTFSDNTVLAGSIQGQKAFASLLQRTVPPTKPEVCFIDFTGTEVATTSFLRDSVIAYRNYARSTWPNIYPVCANLSPQVKEELDSFLKSRGDAIVVCDLDNAGNARNAEVAGLIDGKQGVALQGVLTLGESDAPSLHQYVGDDVTATAWNNRLSMLASKGILIEVSSGRNKRFRPVLEGLHYGT